MHIDLVGPLPQSQRFTHLLTCVDRFTRWTEVISLSSITAEAVARAFMSGWISRFGIPDTVVTDRGAQFESHFWSSLSVLLGVKHAHTTAYHPQANGMVKRFHRQLKASLRAAESSSWINSLPLVMLGINTALKEDVRCTAAEMVYGSSLRLPGEFFTPSPATELDPSSYVSRLKLCMRHMQPSPLSQSTRSSFVSDQLTTCTHVFVRHDAVRKPLRPPYDGPYLVLERHAKYFLLDIDSRRKSASIDRLKPAHLEMSSTDAVASFSTDSSKHPTHPQHPPSLPHPSYP